MMPTRLFRLAPLLAAGLAGCMTHKESPTLSLAVIEAREHRNADATAACTALVSPVRVAFGFDESQINELALPALETASQLLSCHPQASVLIFGEPDAHGTPQERAELAKGRAQAVADDLRSRGVVPARMQTQIEGEAPAGDAAHLVVLAEGRRW